MNPGQLVKDVHYARLGIIISCERSPHAHVTDVLVDVLWCANNAWPAGLVQVVYTRWLEVVGDFIP